MMCITYSLRVRRRRAALGAGFACLQVEREAEERSAVGLLERVCFIPSVHTVRMYRYKTKLILYNAKCQVSQIDVASRELNDGVLSDRLQYLEYFL
jgi:hypothetical protein